MKLKLLAVSAFTAILFGCDDSTTGVGDFVSNIDKIEAFSNSYKVTSRTERLDKIYSRTNRAYLGKYTDPDFGEFTASFITQINCPEGFEFPEHLDKITGTSLELYYSGYYGDSLATLTVQVDEVSEPITDENVDLFYTSYQPENYCKGNTYLNQKSYSATDLSVSDSIRNTSGYYPEIKIDLGEDFRQRIQESTNHPEYYKDAYSFVNNVIKGFYVHTIQGNGSVVYIQDIWLRINMDYYAKRASTGVIDSLVHGNAVLAASKEVLMATSMDNEWNSGIVEETGHTYLKTPAGLCTEVKLPIDDIYAAHKDDTLNSVTLSIKKYRYLNEDNEDKSPYKMGIPQNVLLVRKGEFKDFFEKNKTYDNKTSFIGTYNNSSNSYTFSKLNRLISHIFSEIRSGENNTEDRDKVLLIPVTTETDTKGNIIGVSHDMEVNAARLFGGETGEELNIEVIYTKP